MNAMGICLAMKYEHFHWDVQWSAKKYNSKEKNFVRTTPKNNSWRSCPCKKFLDKLLPPYQDSMYKTSCHLILISLMIMVVNQCHPKD